MSGDRTHSPPATGARRARRGRLQPNAPARAARGRGAARV